MPHLVFESSPGLLNANEKQLVLRSVVDYFSKFETIDPTSVKSRFYEPELFAMGDGAGDSFLHLTISMVEGRPIDILDQIGRGINQFLHTMLASGERSKHINVTIEIRQMCKATYYKASLK